MAKKVKKSDFIASGQVAVNRRATFDYAIEETFTAGLELRGTEVKSLRLGRASLTDTYGSFCDGELFIENLKIEEYANKGYEKQEPNRKKKLLLTRHEINRIIGAMAKKVIRWLPSGCILTSAGWPSWRSALARAKSCTTSARALRSAS